MSQINLTKAYYPIAFTRQGVVLIHQALGELPSKVSRELLNDIEAQLHSIENPPMSAAPHMRHPSDPALDVPVPAPDLAVLDAAN